MTLYLYDKKKVSKIFREGWRQLMRREGFLDVTVAGEAASAPALLARQSVVVGISDGAIIAVAPEAAVASRGVTRPTTPGLPAPPAVDEGGAGAAISL